MEGNMANNSYPYPLSAGAFKRVRASRGLAFGAIILGALIAFEIFNYSTTEYALADLLGNLTFLGIPWATILSLAFCGIDFAGIARLHTPEDGTGQPNETWYLFGAWILAATMNATLTWWGVSLALINHASLGSSLIDRGTMVKVVPVFVSVLVWLIRVLIIGTYSTAGTRLLTQRDYRKPNRAPSLRDMANSGPARSLGNGTISARTAQIQSRTFSTAAPKPQPASSQNPNRIDPSYSRPEPEYVPAVSAAPLNQANRRFNVPETGQNPARPPDPGSPRPRSF